MADFITPALGALRLLIRSAWPEVAGKRHPIFRATQVSRRPWRTLMEKQAGGEGQLSSPWVVIAYTPPTRQAGYGSLLAYASRITVFYVTEIGMAQGKDVAGWIEGKLGDLHTLVQGQMGWPGFQCMGADSIDVTDENPANAEFLRANLPMMAGAYGFDALMGYNPHPEASLAPAGPCGEGLGGDVIIVEDESGIVVVEG